MAHKKAGGSTRLGRDSKPKYLGVKVGDGQEVKTGMILVKQRGTKIYPGKNVDKGRDDTLYSKADGIVKFQSKKKMNFAGSLKDKTFVSVETK